MTASGMIWYMFGYIFCCRRRDDASSYAAVIHCADKWVHASLTPLYHTASFDFEIGLLLFCSSFWIKLVNGYKPINNLNRRSLAFFDSENTSILESCCYYMYLQKISVSMIYIMFPWFNVHPDVTRVVVLQVRTELRYLAAILTTMLTSLATIFAAWSSQSMIILIGAEEMTHQVKTLGPRVVTSLELVNISCWRPRVFCLYILSKDRWDVIPKCSLQQ